MGEEHKKKALAQLEESQHQQAKVDGDSEQDTDKADLA